MFAFVRRLAVIASLAAAAAGLQHAAHGNVPSRPNVIIILADDLGYGDLACYGHAKFKTPHLDGMAAEGARLTQFNCPASFCAPTRASLMTGRYPLRCGMPANPAPDGGQQANGLHLPETEITLAQLFKAADYATGMVGKWHLGHAKPEWLPTHRGFDEYFGIPYSNDMRPVQLVEADQRLEYPVVQANLTDRYTQRALAFVEKNRDRPFFLYLAHAMPHKPLAASEAYYKQSGAGLYGDAIRELDAGIGRLLAKLKELELDYRTLIIFTSDNGPWFGGSTAGLRGMKGSTYEGGYRVPCIVRWPGKIPAGRTCPQFAVTMDLFATVLKAAEIEPPADRVIDGRDLLPLLTGEAPSPHEVVLLAQGPNLAAVRDARWKLHVLPPRDGFMALDKPGERWTDPRGPDGVTILAPYEQHQPGDHPGLRTGDAPRPMQLFDLDADPGEQRDVSTQHPDVVARLKRQFEFASRDLAANGKPPVVAPAALNEHGFLVHKVESAFQQDPTEIRVLLPDRLDEKQTYPVVYVLPVEAQGDSRYGDGLLEVKQRGVHNKHDSIFVAPTFSHLPWYADHPTDPSIRQETYLLDVVIPFVERTYPAPKTRNGRLLLGFSKSGWVAWSLLLRHPDLFGRAAAWDAPLMMDAMKYGSASVFGSQNNFQAYRIADLLQTNGSRLGAEMRLIMTGFGNFRADHERAHLLLDQLAIKHIYCDGPQRKHDWHSGWLPEAVESLLRTSPTP